MLSEQTTILRDDAAVTLPHRPAERIALALSDILSLIAKDYTPLHVSVPKGQAVVLGRNHHTNSVQPHIDLTPYGGTEEGASRVHAAIRHDEDGWWIEDLNSSNGTWVNGRRIAPFTPYPLEGTTLLTLSKLEIRVTLPGNTLLA
jgi:pSer/pThr/pTyr-binding forkhead associated (FHA) protein